jgi:hypothetical protein
MKVGSYKKKYNEFVCLSVAGKSSKKHGPRKVQRSKIHGLRRTQMLKKHSLRKDLNVKKKLVSSEHANCRMHILEILFEASQLLFKGKYKALR